MILSKADAQAPRPGADPFAPPVPLVPAKPAQPVKPVGGATGGTKIEIELTTAGRATWEYKFVDQKNADRATFEKALTDLGTEGWEYVGTEKLDIAKGAANQAVMVFKRSKGALMTPAGVGPAPAAPGGADWSGWEKLPNVIIGGLDIELDGLRGVVSSRVFKLEYMPAADIAAAIGKGFSGKTRAVIADPGTNIVIVVADAAVLKEIAKLVETANHLFGDKVKLEEKQKLRPELTPPPAKPPQATLLYVPSVAAPAKAAGPISVIALAHATAEEMAVTLKKVFPTLEITAESRTNKLIVRGDEKTVADLQALVKVLDQDAPQKGK